MSESKRKRQAFVTSEGQIEKANVWCYEKAQQAQNLYEELYWWMAVFHQNTGNPYSDDLSSKLVRELFYPYHRRRKVNYLSQEDVEHIIIGIDPQQERGIKATEVMLSKKAQNYTPYRIIESSDEFQLIEMHTEAIVGFLLLLEDLLWECKEEIVQRLVAYLLVRNNLDKFLIFAEETRFEKLRCFIREANETKFSGQLTKKGFLKNTNYQRTKAMKSLRKAAERIVGKKSSKKDCNE
jgi:hypothetical protein